MGYYDQLGAISPLEVRTPGYVLAEIQTTDTAVKSMTLDIARSNANETFKSTWMEFANEWGRFRDEHASGALAWLSRGTTPVYDKTIDFRRRLKEWQDSFRAAGGQVSQVDALTTGAESSHSWVAWLPWIVVGVGVVGVGGYLLLRPSGPASGGQS